MGFNIEWGGTTDQVTEILNSLETMKYYVDGVRCKVIIPATVINPNEERPQAVDGPTYWHAIMAADYVEQALGGLTVTPLSEKIESVYVKLRDRVYQAHDARKD
jgi:hypothetical protein